MFESSGVILWAIRNLKIAQHIIVAIYNVILAFLGVVMNTCDSGSNAIFVLI